MEARDIKGYEGYYKITHDGLVLSIERKYIHNRTGKEATRKERILKSNIDRKGYYLVTLYRNGIGKVHLVSRLVALAFVPNPMNKPEVNHIDGNKLNNNFL